MQGNDYSKVEEFLKLYRMLELELSKRYASKGKGISVIKTYLDDKDSLPFRAELDMCREIRNLLSHNVDMYGYNVLEPSVGTIHALKKILDHVSAPRFAIDFGTPRERIFCVSPNDSVLDTMRQMQRRGYSHVPVLDRDRMVGVFSPGSLFAYQERKGLISLSNGARMYQLQEVLSVHQHDAEKYLFMPRNATLLQVRAAFETRIERNHRLSAVFITENGSIDEPLLAMLTPWDALKDSANAE